MLGAMGSDESKRDKKIVFWLTAEEEAALEDWRFANRVPSRSEAVRRLIEMGLRASIDDPSDDAAG